jgi:phosphate transport system permease protein
MAQSVLVTPPGEDVAWVAPAGTISRPPSWAQQAGNRVFLGLCRAFAWLSLLLVVYVVGEIAVTAYPAVRQHGTGFLTGTTWDPNAERYAILPEIWGTLYSSVLALALGTAFGLAAAIFLSEGFLGDALISLIKKFSKGRLHPFWERLPDRAENTLRNLIELLAAIPSVVYGLWGIFVVIPSIRPICDWLYGHLGAIPLFSTPLSGPGLLPAAIVLSIMVLPTITALSRDALVSVPGKLRMAAYGMGATRWETILAVILPTASRGVLGAVLLAFGRALGETMALAMLAGNANRISVSLFSPANTLAALLANNFPEAGPAQVGVLMYAALVLLGITLFVNIAGAAVLMRASSKLEAET